MRAGAVLEQESHPCRAAEVWLEGASFRNLSAWVPLPGGTGVEHSACLTNGDGHSGGEGVTSPGAMATKRTALLSTCLVDDLPLACSLTVGRLSCFQARQNSTV